MRTFVIVYKVESECIIFICLGALVMSSSSGGSAPLASIIVALWCARARVFIS